MLAGAHRLFSGKTATGSIGAGQQNGRLGGLPLCWQVGSKQTKWASTGEDLRLQCDGDELALAEAEGLVADHCP